MDWRGKSRRLCGPLASAVFGVIIGSILVTWDKELHGVWNGLGLTGLGVLIGLIGALAGLITILIGMYQLSQLDERIKRFADDRVNKLENQVTEQLHTLRDEDTRKFATMQQELVRALSLSSMVNFTQDASVAESYAQRALDEFEALPYVREILGGRFAQNTILWHWKELVSTNFSKDIPSFHPLQDYRVQAIQWLRGAVDYCDQGSVHLEKPRETFLHLTQLFTLNDQWDKSIIYWRRYLSECANISEKISLQPQDWALLTWRAPSLDAIQQRLREHGMQPVAIGDLPDHISNDHYVLCLGIPKTPSIRYGTSRPIVYQLAPSSTLEKWQVNQLPTQEPLVQGASINELQKWLDKRLEMILTIWSPLTD